jgi:hypothetical protein
MPITMDKLFEMSKKSSIGLPVLFIGFALLFNITAAYNLDFASKYGLREKNECGNEYLEIETPNYQIYNLIAAPNKTMSSYMKNAFIFVQVAWMILITAICMKLFIDIYTYFKIQRNENSTNPMIKFPFVPLGWLILIVCAYIAYFGTYTNYINNLVKGMANADIGNTSTPKASNLKKLFALYLPTLSLIVPIIYVAYINFENFDTIYLIYALLYVIIISLAIQFNTKSLNVISVVNSSYSNTVDDIQKKIVSILGTDTAATSLPKKPPQTDKDKLKTFLIQNIKSIETTDGDNFILQDYKNAYWKYLIHQNGNELKDIYSSSTDAEAKKSIDKIRTDMRNLRNDKSLQSAVNDFTQSTLSFAITIFSIILFGLFHFVYKHLDRPVIGTLSISFIALLFVIIGPVYGWLMRVISKNN